jgi:hypothetical protein
MKLIETMPAWAAGLKAITSKCGTCQRSWAMRQISTRNAGIRMHDCWYCSPRCFTLAAEKAISQLLTSKPEHPNHAARMPLGLLLISRGLLTSEKLKEVTSEQKEAGGDIGELLVGRGIVTEKQVTACRATQWGCPVFSLPKDGVRSIIQVPPTLIQLYAMIPLHYVAATNLLLVGFVHGVEYGLLYVIEQITGCKTQPCFVTPSDFHTQIEAKQKEQPPEPGAEAPPKELKFEPIQTPAQMARILCDSGLDMEADEAVIGKCKEYLWARLKHAPKTIDLLFKTG